MTAWRWVSPPIVQAVHDAQLAEHGGMEGVRDPGLVASALARPQNLAAYGQPDPAALAGAYVHGIVKNHGFIDGNKRTGWIVARLFLADNGLMLDFDKAEAVTTVEALAGGTIDEAAMTDWLRQRIRG